MIQLPSKIRTTLFNASVENDPYELFSHENDRLFVVIYGVTYVTGYPAFGRSKQDVLNGDAINSLYYGPVTFYGPEPLWMGLTSRGSSLPVGIVIVHGVYRA